MTDDLKLAETIVEAVSDVTAQAKEAAEEVVEEALKTVDYSTHISEIDKKLDQLLPLVDQVKVLDETVGTLTKTVESVKDVAEAASKSAAEALDKAVTKPIAETARTVTEPISNPGAVVDTVSHGGSEVAKAIETVPRRTHLLTRRFGGKSG